MKRRLQMRRINPKGLSKVPAFVAIRIFTSAVVSAGLAHQGDVTHASSLFSVECLCVVREHS
jgi:hypothetical protein